jgi:hypothetical protein
MVSTLHRGRFNQRRQKRAPATVSKALRLPSRVQNRATEACTASAVGTRGCKRRSVRAATIWSVNSKSLSA